MSKELEVRNEQDLMLEETLSTTLYPGAKRDSIRMVIAYCKATNIDPMLKAVHLVPMSIQNKETKRYEWRDVVMPGISWYRIKAERSGVYLGLSAPEFGPSITENLGGVTITYPEWCKITVKKLVGGKVANFPGIVFYKEYYARKIDSDTKKKTNMPNGRWAESPYDQLEKCAEAKALRKAFSEILGQQYTAEEMEGKVLLEPVNQAKSKYTPVVLNMPKEYKSTLSHLKFLIGLASNPEETEKRIIEKSLGNASMNVLEELSNEQIDEWVDKIEKMRAVKDAQALEDKESKEETNDQNGN